MDPLSPLGSAFGPMSGGSMPFNPSMMGGSAAADRVFGSNGMSGGGAATDMTMAALQQISMMQMMQMMQMLIELMKGQRSGDAGQAAGGSAGSGGGGAVGSAPAVNSKDHGEITGFIREAASAYGADPKVLTEIARRESSFNTGAVNDWDSNARKGTPSKGLFQFIEPTFNSMAPKAKAANPAAWKGMGAFNWNDWRQQALVAAWAIANGQGSHWATYRAAGGR